VSTILAVFSSAISQFEVSPTKTSLSGVFTRSFFSTIVIESIQFPYLATMSASSTCGHIHTGEYGLGERGAHLVIPSILGPILATFLVFNRVYWRIVLVHQFGLDDICILSSLVGRQARTFRNGGGADMCLSGLSHCAMYGQSCCS
jgi:hypothetical protein